MTSTNKPLRALIVSVIVIGCCPCLPAWAYGYDSCIFGKYTWSGPSVNFGASTISFPIGSWVRSNLDAAVEAWNVNAPGGNFRFGLVPDAATSFSSGDGKNSIFFTSSYAWGANTLAVTLTRRTCVFTSNITEADVLFNTSRSWTFDPAPATPPTPGSPFNFNLVAIHELGHAFGLQHENARVATMNDCYPNGGPLGYSQIHPHGDDVAGDRNGYGTLGAPRDVAVTTYEKVSITGCGGFTNRIQPPAVAYRGLGTGFRFTIENRGTQTESSAPVGFYLSPDRTITTGDLFLGSATFNMAPGFTGTFVASVTVPMSVTPGSYFFGWIIDRTNNVVEVNETNNATAHVSPTSVPSNSPPVACFEAAPTFGSPPLSVMVDAGCSYDPDGGALTYFWDAGDGGGFSGGPTNSYTYWTEGYFTLTLTVFDPQGLSSSSSVLVQVCNNPQEFCLAV